MRKRTSLFLVWSLVGSLLTPIVGAQTTTPGVPSTPVQHVVIIFQENISFDHYFGTYPNAANPPGEPAFYPHPGTPSVNGISGGMMTNNPNAVNTANAGGAMNPFRLDRSQAVTADQNHAYTPEQTAVHGGLMDLFPSAVGVAGPAPKTGQSVLATTGLVMGFYDGNTVTGLWNYAQHFAMNDNSFGTTFGPSTPGAINLISGQTNGVAASLNGTGYEVADGSGGLTVIGDADPIGDVCSAPTRNQVQMAGKNIGDLLNTAGVSWGWFEGGFDLSRVNANGTTGCARSSTSPNGGGTTGDYIPHHAPFQYYASTANPTHARPTSVQAIGHAGDKANHEYDINDFYAAVNADNMPAVSYLKAPGYQDGHAGYSNPLDEQNFVVNVVNFLEQRPEWANTVIIIAYDDSDGWYDHQMAPIVNQSATTADALLGASLCGTGAGALAGVVGNTPNAQGRCGYGPRLPLLVISPFSKRNYVDHTLTDQTSSLRFIEDNWLAGQRIGQGSFDVMANSITNMLDFRNPNHCQTLLLPGSGLVVSGTYRAFGCVADSF